MIKKLCIFFAGFILLSCSQAYCAIDILELEKTNALLRNKQFDSAIEKYDEIIAASNDEDITAMANFNKATALYIISKYEEAESAFTQALAVDDERLEQKIYYNIGNCKYKQSEAYEEVNIGLSIAYCKDAILYFQRAISLDFSDRAAKNNYVFCKKRLEDLQRKSNEMSDEEKSQIPDNQKQQQKEDTEKEKQQQQQQAQQGQKNEQNQQQQKKQKQDQAQSQNQQQDELNDRQKQEQQELEEAQQQEKQDLRNQQSQERQQTNQTPEQKELEDKHKQQQQQQQNQQQKEQQQLENQQQQQRQDLQNQQQQQNQVFYTF